MNSIEMRYRDYLCVSNACRRSLIRNGYIGILDPWVMLGYRT